MVCAWSHNSPIDSEPTWQYTVSPRYITVFAPISCKLSQASCTSSFWSKDSGFECATCSVKESTVNCNIYPETDALSSPGKTVGFWDPVAIKKENKIPNITTITMNTGIPIIRKWESNNFFFIDQSWICIGISFRLSVTKKGLCHLLHNPFGLLQTIIYCVIFGVSSS